MRGDVLSILDFNGNLRAYLDGVKVLLGFDAPKILVVASRQYAQYPAKKFADAIGGTSAIGRYIPGLMTNPNFEHYIEPEVVIVTDPMGDAQAVREAVQNGIPVIGLCDTNNMTSYLDLVIPTNNKGRKALSLIYYLLTREMFRLRGVSTSLTPEDFETEL